MSFIRSFIVSCRISQLARQFSSSLGAPNDKSPNRLPPGYRPINAYALYCQEFLKEKKKEDSVLLAISAAAKQWKSMDEKTKASYQQKAREIGEERKAAFESLPADKKEELQEMQLKTLDRRKRVKRLVTLRQQAEKSGRPKAPLNAYSIYIKEFYAQQDKKPSSAPESQQLMAQAAEKWKSMSEDEKNKYEQQVAPARKAYKKAMDTWKAKQGKAHDKEMEARKKQREKEKIARNKEKLADKVDKKLVTKEVKHLGTKVVAKASSTAKEKLPTKEASSDPKKAKDLKPKNN